MNELPAKQTTLPLPSLTLRGLFLRCAGLLAAVLICLPAIGYFLSSTHSLGWQAALVAALVCWFGSTAALVLTAISRGPQGALISLLVGMLFRMGLPLLAGIWLTRSSPALAEAGVFGAILVFYLVTLVVETLLVLPLVQPHLGAKESGVTHG